MPYVSYLQTCLTLLLLACAWRTPAQPPSGTGLRGHYYAGQNFEQAVLVRSDPTIDFDWTFGPTGKHFVAPGPGLPAEYFSVRWIGHLYAPVSGIYTFQVFTDDGMRVWVGGQRIVDSWRGQRAATVTARLRLTAGRYYPIRVDYFQLERDSRARLAWQLPGTDAEPETIPARYLYQRLPTTARPVPSLTPPAMVTAPSQPVPVTPIAVGPQPRIIPRVKPVVRAQTRRSPRVVAAVPPPAASPDTPAAPLTKLNPVEKGVAITLPNLYFAQGTATLLPASHPTLQALARTLRQQSALRLEIAGHTDNVGDAHLNLLLSEQRAQVIRRYLVQQGIDSARLTARGYGGTRPVADNRQPDERPRNRRVEVIGQ